MKKLIIDTNLLLLLVIGSIDNGKQIRNSSRLNAFQEKDYQILKEIISDYNEILITPYIATEVSNLIDLNGWARNQTFEFLKLFFSSTLNFINFNIKLDTQGQTFNTYGLTDNSLINLVKDHCILTNDDRLCSALYAVNPSNVIQFSVVRKFPIT